MNGESDVLRLFHWSSTLVVQFWRNTADADVIRFLKLFTELPMEEIRMMEDLSGAAINKAKVRPGDAIIHVFIMENLE